MSIENKTPETKPARRKRSLFKSQLKTLIILGVLITVMAVGVAFAIHYFSSQEKIVDEWSEINPATQQKDTYYCKSTETGYVVTDADGKPLEIIYVDAEGREVKAGTEGATAVYETAIGSLLRLIDGGKLTYYAAVDFGGKYTGGDTSFSLIIFPRIKQENIEKIFFHHVDEDGNTVEFTVNGKDTDKNGSIDGFSIEGYERATVKQIVSACMANYTGYTLTTKKLSTDYMEWYDEKNGTDLIENGKINFSEYGLAEGAAYYDITSKQGETYRLYIGDKVPDGNGIYVRLYTEEEGDRNAVYILSNEMGASALFGGNFSRLDLLKGRPEDLVYPQITYPSTMNSYAFADKFSVSKKDGEGYRELINFSYIDLADRNFTTDQPAPYRVNGFEELSGYIFNSDKASVTLQSFYDLISIIGNDYTQTTANYHIKAVELVKDILPEKHSGNYEDYRDEILAAVDKAVREDAELAAVLEKYGLASPEYKITFGDMNYVSGTLMPVSYNLLWISEKTERNTYYVWSPVYQQIVELSEKYLQVLEWDTFDWASQKVYETNIDFLDGIRVTGTDKDTGKYYDMLFEVFSTYYLTFTTGYTYSSPTDKNGYPLNHGTVTGTPKFELEIKTTGDGKYYALLSSNLQYKVQYTDGSAGTEKHVFYLAGGNNNGKKSYIDLTTIKNYCKYIIDNSYLDTLSVEDKKALQTYANQANKPLYTLSPDKKTVTVTHTVADPGDSYGYIASSTYIVKFIFDATTDSILIEAYQQNSQDSFGNILFNEDVMDDFVVYYMMNDGESGLTAAEIKAVKTFYKTLSLKTSDQDTLKITSFDKDGNIVDIKTHNNEKGNLENEGTQYMTAFKNFYKTLLFASYQGNVRDNDIIGGKVLTDEEMQAFKDRGDDCDLKIDIQMKIDNIGYTFRMYNYSATRTYITSNGNGEFYIDRDRATKFFVDAIKAMNGDMSISADSNY